MRLLLLALLAVAPVVFADAVDVSLNARALKGQSHPAVNVHILEPIAGFKLKLKRDDGKTFEFKGGGKPGQTRTVELDQPEGKSHWVGELLVIFPNGSTSSMPLEFDTEFYGSLSMKCDKDKDVDIAKRRIVITLSRPAGKVALKVLMDTGKYAFDGDIPFNGEAPGTPLELTWPDVPGNVMRVNIQAYDTATFFTGVELTPWRIDIPHEELNFDTGKWDIRPEEQRKLDKSYELITEAVSKYGRLAEIRLYVAGHTDTVGSSESNRTLSNNRARSIASYFRRKGLKVPIYCEGFGEQALAVQTADEVDEQKNRRAEYIISIDDPSVKNTSYQPRWQKL